MLYPSTKDLLEKVDSRYTLVLAASKRARQIIDGAEVTVRLSSKKPVTLATQEIYEGKVTYTREQEEGRLDEAGNEIQE